MMTSADAMEVHFILRLLDRVTDHIFTNYILVSTSLRNCALHSVLSDASMEWMKLAVCAQLSIGPMALQGVVMS